MNIIVSNHSGFCFGVKRAVDTVYNQVTDDANITYKGFIAGLSYRFGGGHKEAPAPAPVAAKPAAGAGTKVGAPLPGTITEVKVKVGDIVKAGDAVIILEAMKMQNNIEAEVSGTVSSVLVKEGDTVMEGDALITIA